MLSIFRCNDGYHLRWRYIVALGIFNFSGSRESCHNRCYGCCKGYSTTHGSGVVQEKEVSMDEQRETVTWEELSWSNYIEQEATIRLLVAKGIISKDEFLNEVRLVQQEYARKKS